MIIIKKEEGVARRSNLHNVGDKGRTCYTLWSMIPMSHMSLLWVQSSSSSSLLISQMPSPPSSSCHRCGSTCCNYNDYIIINVKEKNKKIVRVKVWFKSLLFHLFIQIKCLFCSSNFSILQ